MKKDKIISYLDDLSFSGIVSKIDGDENIGKKVIVEVFDEIQRYKNIVIEKEKELKKAEDYLNSLNESVDKIFHHLDWKKPMGFLVSTSEKFGMILISDKDITFEDNII